MTKIQRQALYALGAFLAAWQATEFTFEARAILGAFTCAYLAQLTPARKPATETA